ncbi:MULTISPECIES: DUF3894 domain-containing protein [unclassified Bacillus (in: firmicutes)]|uniref:DUF3894 domain-containing protein n=1 Tax=unclassified Bacillus (in: firmicutes) TaxID=185979 RepID=UPI003D1F9450
MYINQSLPYIQFLVAFLSVIAFILAIFNIFPFTIAIFFISLLNFTFAIAAFYQKHYSSFVLALAMGLAFSIAGIVIIIK